MENQWCRPRGGRHRRMDGSLGVAGLTSIQVAQYRYNIAFTPCPRVGSIASASFDFHSGNHNFRENAPGLYCFWKKKRSGIPLLAAIFPTRDLVMKLAIDCDACTAAELQWWRKLRKSTNRSDRAMLGGGCFVTLCHYREGSTAKPSLSAMALKGCVAQRGYFLNAAGHAPCLALALGGVFGEMRWASGTVHPTRASCSLPFVCVIRHCATSSIQTFLVCEKYIWYHWNHENIETLGEDEKINLQYRVSCQTIAGWMARHCNCSRNIRMKCTARTWRTAIIALTFLKWYSMHNPYLGWSWREREAPHLGGHPGRHVCEVLEADQALRRWRGTLALGLGWNGANRDRSFIMGVMPVAISVRSLLFIRRCGVAMPHLLWGWGWMVQTVARLVILVIFPVAMLVRSLLVIRRCCVAMPHLLLGGMVQTVARPVGCAAFVRSLLNNTGIEGNWHFFVLQWAAQIKFARRTAFPDDSWQYTPLAHYTALRRGPAEVSGVHVLVMQAGLRRRKCHHVAHRSLE